VLIPNALQPAVVEQVLLCDMIGRAIVLVQEDQLSLAIGRRGQNVRLASKLCGWDIEIMTGRELEEQIERAVAGFSQIEGITEDVAQALVEQGYLSYDDLSVIEPDVFVEMSGLSEQEVDRIVEMAETMAEQAEQAAAEERRARKEREQIQREAEEAGIAEPQPEVADDESSNADSGEAAAASDDSETGESKAASEEVTVADETQEAADSTVRNEATPDEGGEEGSEAESAASEKH
jgi:N utilization substance protein A